MRFAFDDDQLAFRDALRALLARECGPDVVRSAWPDDGTGAGARADASAPARLWTHLADMGVLGVAVPETSGGLGLDPLGWVLLAEEAGYAAVPHPFGDTVAVVAPVLAAAGDPGGRLAGVLAGRTVVAVGFDETSDLVPHGAFADLVLLRRAGTLVLCALDGVESKNVPSVDGSRHLVEIDRGHVAGSVVADEPAVADRAFERGALATAAELIGLGRRMLDLTVAHVTERRQFGVPIGSFQAVKHHLADVLMHLELAAPAVHRAAHSLAHDSATVGRDTSMAKAMAADAAHLAGAKALQCHGAIGYTVEYDLHLYLKRAHALGTAWGSTAWHRNRVGQAIGV